MKYLLNSLIEYRWKFCEKHALLIVWFEMMFQLAIAALMIYVGIQLFGYLQ